MKPNIELQHPASPNYHASRFWNAQLDRTVCDRYNNCDLILTVRVRLLRIDPPIGSSSRLFKDADGIERKIIGWNSDFEPWTRKLKDVMEKELDGKLWLKCPNNMQKWDYYDLHPAFPDAYRPNVCCRFRFEIAQDRGTAHHVIYCVRLHRTTRKFRASSGTPASGRFTANRGRFFEKIINRRTFRTKIPGRRGKHRTQQITAAHEGLHFLGIGHVGEEGPSELPGYAICHSLAATNPRGFNVKECYGISAEGLNDLAGTGNEVRTWHAKPWQEAAAAMTGTKWESWKPEVERFFPRRCSCLTVWNKNKPKRDG